MSHSLPEVGAKLIVVQIGEQQFAIDIMTVREIRGWTACTPLPHAPTHVLGMINLRGAVLAVIDLGARLGLAVKAPSTSSVVVVAQIQEKLVGLVVDAVCDILDVTENMVQSPPDIGSGRARDLVDGIMTTEAGIVSLLRLDNLLDAEQLDAAA
jgi:purine-binding chemotaxis protein CheW